MLTKIVYGAGVVGVGGMLLFSGVVEVEGMLLFSGVVEVEGMLGDMYMGGCTAVAVGMGAESSAVLNEARSFASQA